jgi:endonuclease YncB( thermonuclease family)
MPLRVVLCVFLSLLLSTPTVALADFSGRVVGVTDGDTIKVLHDGKKRTPSDNGERQAAVT